MRLRATGIGVTFAALTQGCGGGESPSSPMDPSDSEDSVRVAWMADNATSVRSIDPRNESWSDLEALSNAIGDARIVLLGEPTHGDGPALQAKSRLVNFLYAEMGFDVLVFENGIYPVAKAWSRIRDGVAVRAALQNAIFPIWMGSAEVDPVFALVERSLASARPLEVAGLDSQLFGSATGNQFVGDLKDLLVRMGSDTLDESDWPRFLDLLTAAVADAWWDDKPSDTDMALFDRFYTQVQKEVEAGAVAVPVGETAFWTQVLRSTRTQLDIDKAADPDVGYTKELSVARDLQMGENLVWLARERFPNRKLIVWAANYHIIRNIRDVQVEGNPTAYEGVSTMGDVVHAAFGTESFALGFTAYEGVWGYWFNQRRVRIQPPITDVIERYLAEAGATTAFLSLKDLPADGRWLTSPLGCQLLGYNVFRSEWPSNLDALFFIRTMWASTPAAGASTQSAFRRAF